MYFNFGKGKSKKKSSKVPTLPPSPDAAAFGRYLRYGRSARFGRTYFGAVAKVPMFGKKKKEQVEEEEMEFGKRRRRTRRFGNFMDGVTKFAKGAVNGTVGNVVSFGKRRRRFGNPFKVIGEAAMGKGIISFGKRRRRTRRFGNLFNEIGKAAMGKGIVSFGRRRYRRKGARKSSRKVKKVPKALIRQCRKHGIKCTRKVGGRRVYKKLSVLKKQLRRKKALHKRKHRKSRKVRRTRRRSTRFSLFGLKF
jgi:hypothetical protein